MQSVEMDFWNFPKKYDAPEGRHFLERAQAAVGVALSVNSWAFWIRFGVVSYRCVNARYALGFRVTMRAYQQSPFLSF